MRDILAEVIYQKPLPGDYFRIGLKTGLSGFTPGQFAMLAVPQESGVLLRRPFSLARQDGEITEILYKVVGKGTSALSRVSGGTKLKILAPLGNGFHSGQTTGPFVAVAGGYGVAPFWEMAVQLKKQNKALILFYGARSSSDLMYLDEFNELGVEVHLSTEDGSRGFQGKVTELLAQVYHQEKPGIVWSCGPMGLLRAVNSWCEPYGVECELSVEEAMGCGTGICLGCVIPNREGHFLRTCIEGPVFPGSSLEVGT